MFVGQASQPRPPGQLPVEPAGFVGRQAELAMLGDLLEHARLVTVTGPGGVGKTRLALRAAARARTRFTAGARLADLSTLRDPALLPRAVAGALGLPGPPAATRGAPPWDVRLDAVLDHLRDQHLLLLLDTCEHLIDACALFAEAVIARAPGVTLLATSREPLDVIGEASCPIAPLPVPERPTRRTADGTAVDLFIQRATAAVPGFTAGPAELPHVIRTCQRLDGIPLAIELAATRLRALPLAELASRLDQGLTLLTDAQRGGRHKTLRDAIGWSYELCTPDEQRLWARLSVFAGPFSIAAAQDVCADASLGPDQVTTAVIRLVDKSVVVRADPADAGAAAQARYLMLGTFREFGAERLAQADDKNAVTDRFITRYLAMARSFRDDLLDPGQLAEVRDLRHEHANLRAALEYTLESSARVLAADGVALATALSACWRSCGLTGEGGCWLDKAAERAPARCRVPGQLTAREREIAMLVADGLSNRQVAERLFISRRTVDAHVEHIFAKLGITSRDMIAIQLRQHGNLLPTRAANNVGEAPGLQVAAALLLPLDRLEQCLEVALAEAA